jgi:enamine deaminase RidA (YjgF/YER057c/UK114 family)
MNATVERRLREVGLTLPPQPVPAANYLPFAREGGLVQLAGVAPTEHGAYAVVGKIGRDLTLEDGQRAARLCALNMLANLRAACGGDLDRVRRVMMVRGFVNAAEDFEGVPLVMNGASDLIVEVFGPEIGRHARTSIGCATLPSRVAVEIDALVVIDSTGL